MDLEKFEFIKKESGPCASWAIWEEVGATPKSNMRDISVLDSQQNPNLLSQRLIILESTGKNCKYNYLII